MKPVTCAISDEWPVNPPAPRAAPFGKLRLVARKSPRHVLVVDDEPLIRWSVTETLTEAGFDVDQASDAASALRLVTTASAPFEALVVDLRLPDMHDLSLVKTLRQLEPSAQLVLMTAFSAPDVVAEAEALGATVIGKPFELKDLRALVH